MLQKIILISTMITFFAISEAVAIKVLIIDDVFNSIPRKNTKISKMGKMRGDLLVNGTHYLGNIEVWKDKEGIYLINELPLEEYVKSVVSAEVGINWDMEALKSQAVISRTYALYQVALNHNNSKNYDLTSSVLHQVYKGATIDPRISSAVMSTEGEVLTYNGNMIEALYHSTCGGKTESAEEVFSKSYPYMKPVESNCELSPYWIWERKIPIEEIEKSLDVSGIKEISIKSYTSTDRVKSLDIIHADGTLTIKSNNFRKSLGWKRLPSTNFTLTQDDSIFTFEGKGYGHGVGLCQWSALEMSRNGKNYKEILSFFYPGSVLQRYENR